MRQRFPIAGSAVLLSAIMTTLSSMWRDPIEVAWSGGQCVLADQLDPALHAVRVEFDLDGDARADLVREVGTDGRYVAALAAASLPGSSVVVTARDSAGAVVATRTFELLREAEETAANAIAAAAPANIPVSLCGCDQAGLGGFANAMTTLTRTREAGSDGVSLVDGAVITRMPLFEFSTVGHDVNFELYHHSLTEYAGPVGSSVSHSFNTFIVQDDSTTGRIVTPDLRVYPIAAGTGDQWVVPEGFFATLQRDAARGMWVLTHHGGKKFEFFLGATGLPGNILSVTDTNDNRLSMSYDGSGRLVGVTTPTGQRVNLNYNGAGRISSISDPIGRTWLLGFRSGNLVSITTPPTQVTVGTVTDATSGDALASTATNAAIVVSLLYDNSAFPSHITTVRNGLGQGSILLRYDSAGRVAGRSLGGPETTFWYDDSLYDGAGLPLASAQPVPRPKLDYGNRTTRVVDRVGNVMDVEMHGDAGGPLGGLGRFGVRRVVQWTERGIGRAFLRANEPDWWEMRWLHDSNSLTPKQACATFRSDAGLAFDSYQMPIAWPVESFTYNQWRQVTAQVTSDGTQTQRMERAYQAFDPAHGLFTRLVSATAPRAFGGGLVDSGLSFTTTIEHDSHGNVTRIVYPAVTRGQGQPQTSDETFVRNSKGQILVAINGDGNATTFDYFTSSQPSSSINAHGQWEGYLSAISRGAPGSHDDVVNQTEHFAVNNLGMVTQVTDGAGKLWSTEYTTLTQVARQISPPVALGSGATTLVRAYLYDKAGRRTLERMQNVDHDGQARANGWIDTVLARDVSGNVTSIRRDVDADPTHDVVTRFAYDGNGLAIAAMEPQGNRAFRTFDERRLPLRIFEGVAAPTSGSPLQGYPGRSVASSACLSSCSFDFDARGSLVKEVDGRGNATMRFFDFLGREVGVRDPNGNGSYVEYDAAGNVLATSRGMISTAGALVLPLSRTYRRYDERNRNYLEVADADVATDEGNAIDPRASGCAFTALTLSAGSQEVARQDALGGVTRSDFDAAGRRTSQTDALGNVIEWTYDGLGQPIEVRAKEVDPFAPGTLVTSVGRIQYDALGRALQVSLLGKVGAFQPNTQAFTYDSVGFRRTFTDEEGQVNEQERDDLMRVVTLRTRNAAGIEKARTTRQWDANSRLVAETDFNDVANTASGRTKQYAWDDLDRQIRRVDTDSDDPISGIGLGADGVWDRMEWAWDANSNIISMTDERGLAKSAVYDAANRLVSATVTAMGGTVHGVTGERFRYDALGRATEKANDCTQIQRSFSALGFVTQEIQSIRLDGTGLTRGWIEPVTIDMGHDAVGDTTTVRIGASGSTDLALVNAYDSLRRLSTTDATYMNSSRSHRVASFVYEGLERTRQITFGNGAKWSGQFDSLGRTHSAMWTSATNSTLAGFEYDYDRASNPLWERVMHDGGRYDNFGYGAQHELTGAEYRAAQPADYRTQTPAWNATWAYDSRHDRTASSEVDPFGGATIGGAATYVTNLGDQYSLITRGTTQQQPLYDRFGSAIRLPVYPRTGSLAGDTSMADATYDVHAQLDTLTVTGATQHYVYDVEHRRVASFTSNGSLLTSGKRWTLFGPHEATERTLATGVAVGDATSRLRAIHVFGDRVDQVLFSAIDGNGDGVITAINGNPYATAGWQGDFAYYHLLGGLGSTAALLDADNSGQVLEYYEYTAFGEATVLPVVDSNHDGLEDTPTELADNHTQMLRLRSFRQDPAIGRSSRFENVYLFAGCRVDAESGHLHMRMRQYDPIQGRFTSRDWAEELAAGRHPYAYVGNQPTTCTDPTGLKDEYRFTVGLTYVVEGSLWCLEQQKLGISANVSGSGTTTSPPLLWGISVQIQVAISGSGSGKGVRCTDPECTQILGEFALKIGLQMSLSAGYSFAGARADIGLRTSGSVSGTYNPCKGEVKVTGSVSVSIFARFVISMGWFRSAREISVTIANPDGLFGSFDAPKLNCDPCPCCQDPVATPVWPTTTIATGDTSVPGPSTPGSWEPRGPGPHGPATPGDWATGASTVSSPRTQSEVWNTLCTSCCN